jgi:hypothetical protein
MTLAELVGKVLCDGGKLDWVMLRRRLATEGPLGCSRREWSGLRLRKNPG